MNKHFLGFSALTLAGFAAGFALAAETGTNLGTVGNYKIASMPQAGTSCTLSNTAAGCSTQPIGDSGTLVDFTSASAVTVTLPNNLPVGFTFTAEQDGAGTVTFSCASAGCLHSPGGFVQSSGQYAIFGVRVHSNVGGSAAQYTFFGQGAT